MAKIIIGLIFGTLIISFLFFLIPVEIPSFDTSGNAWNLINWGLDILLIMGYWIGYIISDTAFNAVGIALFYYFLMKYVIKPIKNIATVLLS